MTKAVVKARVLRPLSATMLRRFGDAVPAGEAALLQKSALVTMEQDLMIAKAAEMFAERNGLLSQMSAKQCGQGGLIQADLPTVGASGPRAPLKNVMVKTGTALAKAQTEVCVEGLMLRSLA